jgi:DnaK suppressor protein
MKNTENNGSDLDLIKHSLLMQKSEILNKNFEFKSQQSTLSKTSDEADAVTQELASNLSIQLHERDRHSLILIEKALSKFANDTYGMCEACEEPIDVRRLKARPLATLCISCMEDQETLQKTTLQ